MPATEQELRDRIHDIFFFDRRPPGDDRECPAFWIPPADDLVAAARDLPCERVDAEEAAGAEEKWLSTPNPTFGGKCPNQLLAGNARDRRLLATAAVEQGAFT